MRTGRPEHLRTFDYLGLHRYFLTFCTFERRRLFTTPERVEIARTQILRASVDQRFAITAYCFMPDHVHLLVESQSEGADCRAFILRAKQFSGFYYKRSFGERLWQRYGYERVLRNDEQTLSVARYIVENPVRARLTRGASEYPFSGSELYSLADILDAVQMSSNWRSR